MGFEDSLKSVLKVLVKVPILIVVIYFCFNILAFISCYYKIMGASYSLQQIAMENNYIPAAELEAFEKYIEEAITYSNTGSGSTRKANSFTPKAHIVIFTHEDGDVDFSDKSFWRKDVDARVLAQEYVDNGSVGAAPDYDDLFYSNNNTRQQYGETIWVGIACDFQIQWPLRHDQTLGEDGLAGWQDGGGSTTSGDHDILTVEEIEAKLAASQSIAHIDVVSPVVGLQYYSDLESTSTGGGY